jgi:hypothetical protein
MRTTSGFRELAHGACAKLRAKIQFLGGSDFSRSKALGAPRLEGEWMGARFSSRGERGVILNRPIEDGETTLSDNKVSCYSVKVEIRYEVGRPTVTFDLVPANTQSAAIKAVEEVLPGA